MTNTLVVKEDRKTIDKFRDWYKEKFIDTGKSQDLEAKIEKKAEMEKKVIKIAGAVATIVLLFCPADGPVGEVCTVLATPLTQLFKQPLALISVANIVMLLRLLQFWNILQ